MRLSKAERACLEGALKMVEISGEGSGISPTSDAGARAVKRLTRLKLLELVGWAGDKVTGPPVYVITSLGKDALSL